MLVLPFLLIAVAALLSVPLGRYLRWAMDPLAPGPRRARFEAFCVRLGGPLLGEAQDWRSYAAALVVSNAVFFVLAVAVLALQPVLPLNPDHRGALGLGLIFHTAASFVTNTDQQHYAGEATLGHAAQLALMWLQFLSPATGLAALVALARALAGRTSLGNFHVDLLRAVLLVLLPGALVLAFAFVLTGMPMTLAGAVGVTTLEGGRQWIARGPVAAFVAIKQLGTNGGGFFGANGTHPFENPNAFSALLSLFVIPLLPMAGVWLFGRIVERRRHAAAVFGVMLALLLATSVGALAFEHSETSALVGVEGLAHAAGNLEGKELRFGPADGVGPSWAAWTTATSNGSVAAMHDSLAPLAGAMPMVGMWLNAAFGGVGVGMINMLLFVLLAVFLAGMLVGRTPEYLNRRLEAGEMRLVVLTLLAHGVFTLVGTALFAGTPWGASSAGAEGPHAFSRILYELSSAAANNGSGFEGLSDASLAWNLATGAVILFNRYLPIVLPLAAAASLGAKRRTSSSAGTLGVEDPTFACMLLATIVVLGALTFFPAAVLGPVAEHLLATS